MEQAATAGRLVPISDRLRRRLELIPSSGVARVVPFPLPQAPLPDRLRERLRAIPLQAAEPRRPPSWILQPRYAVAASYLLAVLLTLALGDPVTRGRQAVEHLEETFVQPLQSVESRGLERLRSLEDRTLERYGETRRGLEESFSTLGFRVTAISRELLSSDIVKNGPWPSAPDL
jgi:hypothetical protein